MLRMKLFFHELFVYKIPSGWNKFINACKRNKLNTFVALFIIVVGGFLSIYSGIQAYHTELNNKTLAKMANAPYDENGLMRIPKAGPMAYLKLELSAKSDKEVEQLFNNNVKYQGKLNEVLANTQGFTKNSQYQDYLNPIIDEIQNGQTISGEKTGIKFSSSAIDITQNDAVSGVMLIAIDSSKPEQVKLAQSYMAQKRPYKLVFFDTHTKGGLSLFYSSREQYLFSGDNERTGFNSSNDWIGSMYAFNNQRWVYRSKGLVKELPKTLSNSSLNKTDEYQFKHVYSQQ